jgi:hypothetical protein
MRAGESASIESLSMKSYLKKKPGPSSFKMYRRPIRELGLSLAEIGLLTLLKSYTGKLGVIPSVETMCEDCGADRKTVFKYLKSLEEIGLINRVPRIDPELHRRSSNCYILNDEKMAQIMAVNAVSRVPKNGTRPYRPKKRDDNTSEGNKKIVPFRAAS